MISNQSRRISLVGALTLLLSACPAKHSNNNVPSMPPGSSIIQSDPKAVPQARQLVGQMAGKKLMLSEEVETETWDGTNPFGTGNPEVTTTTADQTAKATGCSQTDQSFKQTSIPCDNVLGFTLLDPWNALVVTQTAPQGKKMITRYTLDKNGKLELTLIEVTPSAINLNIGGTVVIEDGSFKLRLTNPCGYPDVTQTCTRTDDHVFQISKK